VHKTFAVMDRLRERLLEEMQKHAWSVTFSIGVVTFEALPDSVLEMLRLADETMYQSKHGGKNRITQAVVTGAAQSESAEKPLVVEATLLRPHSETSEVSF
jgi:hypothetical protein